MPKSKLSVFLSLLLVFCSGLIVGALAYRLYMVKTVSGNAVAAQPGRRPDPEEVRRRIIADVKAQLHLDDQQVTVLNQIMDETNAEFHKMRDKINAEGRALHDQQWQKFRAALRPDQQPLYDQWRTARDNEIRRRREQEHKGPGGPPSPR